MQPSLKKDCLSTRDCSVRNDTFTQITGVEFGDDACFSNFAKPTDSGEFVPLRNGGLFQSIKQHYSGNQSQPTPPAQLLLLVLFGVTGKNRRQVTRAAHHKLGSTGEPEIV